MPQPIIELKGSNFTLSVINLYDAQPDMIRQALKKKMEQAPPQFLKNAPIIINIAKLSNLNNINWRNVYDAIISVGLYVVGISGCSNEQHKREIIAAGLPVLNEGKTNGAENTPPIVATKNSVAKTRICNEPIRSGQQVYAKNSDLIVINNVSAGAELLADGNIHVYGMLRGRALAGLSGNTACQIFCTQLSAELVSIAGRYWMSDQIPAAYFCSAARLYLLENSLTIKPLNV